MMSKSVSLSGNVWITPWKEGCTLHHPLFGGAYISPDELNALCLWWLKRHPELVKPSLTEEERDIIESTAFYHENIAKGYRKGSDADVSHSHQAEVLRSLLERTK
jgi:hypothetical protein